MKNKTKSKKKSWQKYISIIAFMPIYAIFPWSGSLKDA